MGRDLAHCAVVITGASSGIGRAAALGFARRGSRLLLAARAAPPLEQTAAECEALGADVLWQPTDVRDEDQVEHLARRAVDELGGLDVWVNGAGVIAYGRFEDVPSDVFRAVVETNFFGQVHGARAALPRFRQRGNGVLINMASVWGRVTAPDVSAYVASKFAIRAFSECLRQELRELPDVDVATMLPQAVDTPIFARAGNYAGRATRPIPPVVDAETIAQGILRCAESPKPEVTYSRSGRIIELVHSFAPGLYSRLLPPAFEAGNYGERYVPPSAGAVLGTENQPHRVEGGWKGEHKRELAGALEAALRSLARGAWRRRSTSR